MTDPLDDGLLEGEGERRHVKRDRTARLLRVAAILRGHGEAGVSLDEIARQVGMSTRTVYRDLKAIETELEMPVWRDDSGRWGMDADAFLPPLRLTLHEAMAVFLATRVMTRYADKYDPSLGSAFGKLAEVVPAAIRAHVEHTLGELADRPVDARFNRHVADLTRAWAERRVVTFDYAPARYADVGEREPRRAVVRPYLLEPSLETHALYLIGFDETRAAVRTFKVERILDLALTPRTFDPEEGPDGESILRRAWDIIADQPDTTVRLRFAPSVAARVREATWHPTQQVQEEQDGSLVWTARVAGAIEIRLWILRWGDEVEVLEPRDLRADVAATHRRACERYATDA